MSKWCRFWSGCFYVLRIAKEIKKSKILLWLISNKLVIFTLLSKLKLVLTILTLTLSTGLTIFSWKLLKVEKYILVLRWFLKNCPLCALGLAHFRRLFSNIAVKSRNKSFRRGRKSLEKLKWEMKEHFLEITLVNVNHQFLVTKNHILMKVKSFEGKRKWSSRKDSRQIQHKWSAKPHLRPTSCLKVHQQPKGLL